MSEITDSLVTAGAGYTYTSSSGRKWTFTPLPQSCKGELEDWFESQLWETVRKSKRHLEPEEYSELVANTSERIAAGCCKIESKGFDRKVRSVDGFKKFCELLLRPKHPKVTEAEIVSLIEDMGEEELEIMLLRLFPKLETRTERKQAPAGQTP